MFRCDSCSSLSKPGEKQHKVVISARSRTYMDIPNEITTEDNYGNTVVRKPLVIGTGWEIVKEAVHGACCIDRTVSRG